MIKQPLPLNQQIKQQNNQQAAKSFIIFITRRAEGSLRDHWWSPQVTQNSRGTSPSFLFSRKATFCSLATSLLNSELTFSMSEWLQVLEMKEQKQLGANGTCTKIHMVGHCDSFVVVSFYKRCLRIQSWQALGHGMAF